MKIVLQYRSSPGFLAQIAQAFADFPPVVVVDETDKARFAAEMVEADVLLHVLEPVTAAVIAAAPRLKLIQKLGVGVNTIDLEAAKAHGAMVANMPGTNSIAVAEMALSLIFAVMRRTVYFDAITRAGQGWTPDLAVLDQVGEIAGRTVGLVGYGGSAQRLAPVLRALGAEVIYTATGPKPDAPRGYRSLSDLLAQADIVSLHLPLTPATTRMMNAEAFARMKPGSVLINTARGGLVDEPALIAALAAGHLRGAGLDVFAVEPAGSDNPLFALPQVVAAPHVAWLTPETLNRSLTVARENCRRVAKGESLLHRVA